MIKHPKEEIGEQVIENYAWYTRLMKKYLRQFGVQTGPNEKVLQEYALTHNSPKYLE